MIIITKQCKEAHTKSLYLHTPDHQRLHSNMIMILTVRTHLDFSRFPLTDITQPQTSDFFRPPHILWTKQWCAKDYTVKYACPNEICIYPCVINDMASTKAIPHTHMSVCFSDSIPSTLIGVDTRKGSSGWIIEPSTNEFGVHLNTFHWSSLLLYFNKFSYGYEANNAIK